jgi:hypothetical protein
MAYKQQNSNSHTSESRKSKIKETENMCGEGPFPCGLQSSVYVLSLGLFDKATNSIMKAPPSGLMPYLLMPSPCG